MNDTCQWSLVFDGHYNINCCNSNGKRANGNFKIHPEANYITKPKWDFVFCPYCGGEIELTKLNHE